MKQEKEDRQRLILEYIITNEGYCKRSDIHAMLVENGYQIVPSTVSRDIDELDYEKVGDHYVMKVSTADKRSKEILRNLFAIDYPNLAGPYFVPMISAWNTISKLDNSVGINETQEETTKVVKTDEVKKRREGIRLFILQVDSGRESTISELVSSTYSDIVIGCIPGHRCILILTDTNSDKKAIRNEIKGLLTLRSGRKKGESE